MFAIATVQVAAIDGFSMCNHINTFFIFSHCDSSVNGTRLRDPAFQLCTYRHGVRILGNPP